MLVVAGNQAIVGNLCRQMMNMVVRDIRGEPVQPARQDQKTGAMNRGGIVIPALIAACVGMFKIVLHGKQGDARASGQGNAGHVDCKKQHRSDPVRHRQPACKQHDVVPGHVPALFSRCPMACFKRRCMRPDGNVRPGNFSADDVADQCNDSLQPRDSGIEDQVYEAAQRRQPYTSGAFIRALLADRQLFELLDRGDAQRSPVFFPVAIGRMVIRMMF